MSLLYKPLDRIVAEDVMGLVEHGVREDREIEYKSKLPGSSDREKREFLADISSFANTSGGLIVYGIRDHEGKAVGVEGLGDGNRDADVLRLDQIAQHGVEPRIPGLHMRPLNVEGNDVLIIRVPRSWVAPHMVKRDGIRRFWGRSSAGKFELDVGDLRLAFERSASIPLRLEALRTDRLGKVLSDVTPVALFPGQRVVVHLAPFSALSSEVSVDLGSLAGAVEGFLPTRLQRSEPRFNFDGIVVAPPMRSGGQTHAYLQIFRTGVLETVDALLISSSPDHGDVINALNLERTLTDFTRGYIRLIQHMASEFPVAVMITLVGVRGFKVQKDWSENREDGRHPIDRDTLVLPRILVEDADTDLTAVLRPAFDVMWNAAGWPGSMTYDDPG